MAHTVYVQIKQQYRVEGKGDCSISLEISAAAAQQRSCEDYSRINSTFRV
eukprot:SAG31_NODE_330_length_17593_cov_4.817891_12_plen_50_part_00